MRRLTDTNINTAEYWDNVYSNEIAISRERIALERFQRVAAMIPKNSRVLDVGCGTGDFVRHLENTRPDLIITACDFSRSAIEYAAKKSPASTFRVVDILQLSSSLNDTTFDFVVCFETIEHVDDPQKLVDEMQKVLKPGGTIVITTPYDDKVCGAGEHVFAFKYADFIQLFEKGVCSVVAMCRYSENYKNLLCTAKII